MRAERSALLALCLLLPACVAQTPSLEIPSLAAMQRDSVNSVNITLGPASLGFLGFLSRVGGDHDPDAAAAGSLLHGLDRVQIRNFEFATDHTYGDADLEGLRSQLTAPVWRHLVQVRDSARRENVDIYCVLHDHMITRLVIIAAEPREFTLVNVVGTIDPDQVAKLRHDFVPHEHGHPIPALTQSEGNSPEIER